MAHYKVEICGINTSKLPLLSNEEKKTLFDKIKKGDKKAREAYIHGNLRLVLSIIQRFNNSTENVDDLFQIGCIGLMKAIDNFDVTQNVKFSTYAVPMIIGEVRRYLRDYKAIYAKEALMKKQETEPTLEEISKMIDVPPKDIVFALDAIQSPVSLYEPVYSEGGDTLYVMDQISDKKNKESNWVEHLSLKDALSHLPERENHIIQLRYLEGKTQMEVANEIHISQAQVSRLEKNALKIMKNHLEA